MKARLCGSATILLWLAASVSAQDLPGILARMDSAAASFKAVSANVTSLTYTAVIDDKAMDNGSLIMKKLRPGEVEALITFTQPDPRILLFQGRKLQIFYPKIKTLQVYDLGKSGEQIDEYLMIGFGTSGMDLARDFDIKLLGMETVSGREASKLELVPKMEQARNLFSKIELWLVSQGDQLYPVQEKVYEKNGDYRLATYSDVKINPSLPSGGLKLKLPSGVKTEYPQKSQ